MTVADYIKQGEGKTLEFKRDLSSPKNLLKTLVAFANTAGGYLRSYRAARSIALGRGKHHVISQKARHARC